MDEGGKEVRTGKARGFLEGDKKDGGSPSVFIVDIRPSDIDPRFHAVVSASACDGLSLF